MASKSKRASVICSEIERMIANGHFQDGDKLNETALATQFNVSRTPLREAFQALSALNLVELIPNRGAFVKRPSMTRLIEMFEVMAELEAWCASLAAKRITHAQLLYLRQAAKGCQIACENNQPEAYYEANYRLHATLYEASGNSVLADETKRMERRLRPFRRAQLEADGRLQKSMDEHAKILAAIGDGRAEEAAALMRGHIGSLSATYDSYLETLASDAPGHPAPPEP